MKGKTVDIIEYDIFVKLFEKAFGFSADGFDERGFDPEKIDRDWFITVLLWPSLVFLKFSNLDVDYNSRFYGLVKKIYNEEPVGNVSGKLLEFGKSIFEDRYSDLFFEKIGDSLEEIADESADIANFLQKFYEKYEYFNVFGKDISKTEEMFDTLDRHRYSIFQGDPEEVAHMPGPGPGLVLSIFIGGIIDDLETSDRVFTLLLSYYVVFFLLYQSLVEEDSGFKLDRNDILDDLLPELFDGYDIDEDAYLAQAELILTTLLSREELFEDGMEFIQGGYKGIFSEEQILNAEDILGHEFSEGEMDYMGYVLRTEEDKEGPGYWVGFYRKVCPVEGCGDRVIVDVTTHSSEFKPVVGYSFVSENPEKCDQGYLASFLNVLANQASCQLSKFFHLYESFFDAPYKFLKGDLKGFEKLIEFITGSPTLFDAFYQNKRFLNAIASLEIHYDEKAKDEAKGEKGEVYKENIETLKDIRNRISAAYKKYVPMYAAEILYGANKELLKLRNHVAWVKDEVKNKTAKDYFLKNKSEFQYLLEEDLKKLDFNAPSNMQKIVAQTVIEIMRQRYDINPSKSLLYTTPPFNLKMEKKW